MNEFRNVTLESKVKKIKDLHKIRSPHNFCRLADQKRSVYADK